MIELLLIIIVVLLVIIRLNRNKSELFNENENLQNVNLYLINLDRNQDRLAFFINNFNNSDINRLRFNRIEAIDGNKLDIKKYVAPHAIAEIENIYKTGYRTKHYQLSKGAVGCFLSHILIYNTIWNQNRKISLVMEDDAIVGNIYEEMRELTKMVPADWDIILLGYICLKCERYDNYLHVKHFFGTHAYLIKNTAARKILDYHNKVGIDKQIDSFLSEMAMKNMLNIYAPVINMIKQNNKFGTTIQIPLRRHQFVNPYELN